jgi:predicted ATP-grasp superfamily ATP-dependent carboligase
MKTVLLTNGQQRKTLAAARSLGKRGVNVIVAEETRLNVSAFSKYCKKSLVYPSPKHNPDEFYRWLMSAINKYNIHVIFPMDDDTLDVVMKHFEDFSKCCTITLPDHKSYETACDKGKAVKLAYEAGVPCPKTIFPDRLDNLKQLTINLDYPLVIKPRKSSGSRGIRIAKNEEEFTSLYMETHNIHPFPIIQEYIGIGDRYDVCLLYDKKHERKAQFVQKEIRHFPVDIGPSTVQMSIEHPELLSMAESVMKKLPWQGVVELEFMIDQRDNQLKFMEINPRFWGSLQMAIIAGVDFPWLLYKLGTKDFVENTLEYKTGLMCRWLLPGDIFHFITNKERSNMNPPLFSSKNHNIQDDTFDRKDPLPILGFILACFRYLFDINMWKFIFKR